MSVNESISINCHLKYLKKVRDFVREKLDVQSLSRIEKNQLVLAVDEVCTNLIRHSNKEDDTKKLQLFLHLDHLHQEITIEIHENGEPFNYSDYREPNILELKNKRISGQLGMMLVRRVMDKIEYLQYENHNICRLYKRLI